MRYVVTLCEGAVRVQVPSSAGSGGGTGATFSVEEVRKARSELTGPWPGGNRNDTASGEPDVAVLMTTTTQP
jgi:hypothetical protein